MATELEATAGTLAARPLRHLVVGCRTLGRTARLEPLGRRHAAGPLLREAVVGVGIYQGMEFVLQRGLRDVTGKTGTAARRSLCAAAVLRRARVWRLYMAGSAMNFEAGRTMVHQVLATVTSDGGRSGMPLRPDW